MMCKDFLGKKKKKTQIDVRKTCQSETKQFKLSVANFYRMRPDFKVFKN